MFLVITEFGDAYHAAHLSDNEFQAAKDGLIDLYRFDGLPMRWVENGWKPLAEWGA